MAEYLLWLSSIPDLKLRLRSVIAKDMYTASAKVPKCGNNGYIDYVRDPALASAIQDWRVSCKSLQGPCKVCRYPVKVV